MHDKEETPSKANFRCLILFSIHIWIYFAITTSLIVCFICFFKDCVTFLFLSCVILEIKRYRHWRKLYSYMDIGNCNMDIGNCIGNRRKLYSYMACHATPGSQTVIFLKNILCIKYFCIFAIVFNYLL